MVTKQPTPKRPILKPPTPKRRLRTGDSKNAKPICFLLLTLSPLFYSIVTLLATMNITISLLFHVCGLCIFEKYLLQTSFDIMIAFDHSIFTCLDIAILPTITANAFSLHQKS